MKHKTSLFVLAASGMLIEVWLLQVCWNWFAVEVLRAQSITFWQATGLFCLLSAAGRCFRNQTIIEDLSKN